MLLPGASLAGARIVAERLRHAVEELYVANADAPLGQVSVSIGLASMVPSLGDKAQSLIEAADAGLYAAKRLGESMGARLWCEPADPTGARFVVALPSAAGV